MQLRPSAILFLSLVSVSWMSFASAMDLDWHGQFRTETNWLWGYSNGQLQSNPTTDQGYGVPLNGSTPASFQNIFLRFNPRAIVNDNVSIHSDIWVGTPDRGFFGGDLNSTGKFSSTRTGTSSFTANEFFAQVATDFGTFRVGRVPLHYGLGVVWNNDRTSFDRLPSTGDTIELSTRFGAFKFNPAIVKYRSGTNLGGTFDSTGNGSTLEGWSGATDYTLALTYENPDEQVTGGLLFLRRVSGQNVAIINPLSVTTGVAAPGNGSFSFNIWDFYFRKKTGIFNLGLEVPIVSGQVQGVSYSSVAIAVQAEAELSDRWKLKLNGGQADGQENTAGGSAPTKLSVFSFHPDYRPGLILFNFNLRNFSNPSGTNSPYDNPISNARFVSLGAHFNNQKWSYGLKALTAMAITSADGNAANAYFNYWDGYYRQQTGSGPQGKNLGFEVDFNLGYRWDDSIQFGLEMGILKPGSFYEFSNSATPNALKTIFASMLNMRVDF